MTNEPDGVTLTIGFGEPAANTQVVPDAIAALADLTQVRHETVENSVNPFRMSSGNR